jgi:antitoxin component YwqK of YwqJK toxin-antitoxin module
VSPWPLLALAAALGGAPAQPPPLACPKGTVLRGLPPFEGYEQWCEGKDERGEPRREGPARRWYDDGSLWVEESFHEGERDGPFVEYHRNGRKAREGRWVKGKQDGPWTIWWESGALEEEAEWREGVPHGRFAAYRPDGSKRAEGRRCGGAPCGTWTTYDERGQVEGKAVYETGVLTP